MEMVEHGDVASGLTLSPLQEKALEAVLVQLAAKSSAALALLSSRTGHYISSRGSRHDVDTAALASLVAADLAASQQISDLVDATESHTMILREGERFATLIAEAGPSLVLLVVASREVPLGWIRMLVQGAAQRMAEITRPAQGRPMPAPAAMIPGGEFADLVGQAIDDLWTE
jgi:predicted regulator of Ras-like GTPase activity (Roadblock/LC7/MglB family)